MGPFQGPTGALKGPKNSTKMAENITKMTLHGPQCPYMTPNGTKALPMGILHDILSCWTTLGPRAFAEVLEGPKMAQNSTIMALYDQKLPFMTQNGPTMKKLHDPKYTFMTQNVPA